MRKAITAFILGCVLPVCAGAGDPGAMLAEWDGGGISVEQYIGWYHRMLPGERPDVSTEEGKRKYLDNIINAQLMLDEAHALKLDESSNVVEWVQISRTNLLREYVFTEAAKGRLMVDEDEVKRIYDKRAEQITARHIVVPTLRDANTIRDSLAARASFADLASEYSTCVSGANEGYLGPVRWGDFSERWSRQAFALEPGEISQPFEVESGYCIVTVETKTTAELADPEAEKAAIRTRLMTAAVFEERASFLDSLKIGYGVETDMIALVDLCLRYADTLEDLGMTAEVVDVNVVLPLTDSDKTRPVISFEGGVFDYQGIVDMINSQPYVVRPHLDDPDEMVNFLNRHLNDSLVIREALKLGYDKAPEVAGSLEKLKQKRTLMRFFNYTTTNLKVPEDTLRLFYEARKGEFKIQPGHTGSKLVSRTRAEAESLLALIEQGESFEDLAREHSIDLFTAPDGGDMGFLVKGKDPEFDEFFATMEVGDIEIFRSVEGHVVLWLRQRQEEKNPTFEEARAAAEQSLRPVYKERMLKEWVKKRREDVKVKIDEALLAELEL